MFRIGPTIAVTVAEANYLRDERRRALRESFKAELAEPRIHAPKGAIWKAYLRIQKRDRDGSILAFVRCGYSQETAYYVRKLRTPRNKAYTGSRDIRLRRRSESRS
jgi:hypothetical protein